MSLPEARPVPRPPYDIDVRFRVNDESIVRIAKHVDRKMGWSGRPASPAAREIAEYILGLMKAKEIAEKRRAERNENAG